MDKMKKRVGFLDEVRGFAILCMVVYHVMFDLNEIFGVKVPIFFDGWFYIVRDVFAGAFIFISGTVCRYSRDNTKRGAQCFLLGMAVTFVTAFAAPDYPVMFGILHFLGICMIIFGLGSGKSEQNGSFWDILPAPVGIAVNVILFVFTLNIPTQPSGYIGFGSLFKINMPRFIYDAKLLFPLGFLSEDAAFGDYFPLLPWIFLFFAGAYFGVFVKDNNAPAFFYKTRVRFLAAAGRHTIWIYMLHQPIAYLILSLIFRERIADV